jgi:hypothetical protein
MVQRKCGSALRIAACLLGIGLGGVAGMPVGAQSASPLVDKFVLKDTVQPVTEGELDRRHWREPMPGWGTGAAGGDWTHRADWWSQCARNGGGKIDGLAGAGDCVCGLQSGARAGSAGILPDGGFRRGGYGPWNRRQARRIR